jgi:cellulose synthase (UDP-forming)
MLLVSDTLSNLGLTLLIVGLSIAVLPYCNRDWGWLRVLLMLSSIVLSIRYMTWRFAETIPAPGWNVDSFAAWAFALLEAVTVASSCIAAIILSRTLDRRGEATANLAWWGNRQPPKIDVYIATYNEERAVLERTIAGALATTYPNVAIYVLDDGRRPWLRALCASKGVCYLTRPNNAHAKAGNLNYALKTRLADFEPPEFIAVLDADFVPHRDFLSRTVSLFHDAKTGLVQTPQYFFNADPIQHNLGISQAYPDEQRFFFNHVEPARDAWGVAVCCGTSSMVRVTALKEIGGFPTESVTEDFLLTLRLSEHGYRTVYLNEPLTEGLAPEGLQEYIVQRGRWCLGMMQIIRNVYNPISRKHRLSLRQRVSITDSLLYWSSTFPFRLASLLCPLLYWYFGIIVVDAPVSGILAYFTPAYVTSLVALNWLSRGLILPFINDVSQLIGAYPITRAVWMGLTSKGPHKFVVTAKGGDRSQAVVQWPLLRPFLVLWLLTVGGLLFSFVNDYTGAESAGDGKSVILFWSVYNILLLSLTMIVCVERPRPLHSLRPGTDAATLIVNGNAIPAWVLNLSQHEARVRGPHGLSLSTEGSLILDGVGEVSAQIKDELLDGYLIALFPTERQADLLARRVHTQHGAPGTVEGRLTGIVGGFWNRLST